MTYAMKHYASKVSQQYPPLHPAPLSQGKVLQPHKNSPNPFEVWCIQHHGCSVSSLLGIPSSRLCFLGKIRICSSQRSWTLMHFGLIPPHLAYIMAQLYQMVTKNALTIFSVENNTTKIILPKHAQWKTITLCTQARKAFYSNLARLFRAVKLALFCMNDSLIQQNLLLLKVMLKLLREFYFFRENYSVISE